MWSKSWLKQHPQHKKCCRMQVSKTQTSAVSLHLSITIDSKCVSLQIFLSAAKPSGTAPAAVTEQKCCTMQVSKINSNSSGWVTYKWLNLLTCHHTVFSKVVGELSQGRPRPAGNSSNLLFRHNFNKGGGSYVLGSRRSLGRQTEGEGGNLMDFKPKIDFKPKMFLKIISKKSI